MMQLATLTKACVMISCHSINHIHVNLQMRGYFQTLLDNHQSMVAAMRLVETVVSGKDLLLHITFEFGPDRFRKGCILHNESNYKVSPVSLSPSLALCSNSNFPKRKVTPAEM